MASSDIGEVSYRLCSCPSAEDDQTTPCPSPCHSPSSISSPLGYFLSEQATCAAYVYALSSPSGVGSEGESLESLKLLVERDKGGLGVNGAAILHVCILFIVNTD